MVGIYCLQTPPPDMLSHLDDGITEFRLALDR